MGNEPVKQMISLRFDIELMDRIKAIAEREDRTFAAQMQRMLREWLDEHPDAEGGKPQTDSKP